MNGSSPALLYLALFSVIIARTIDQVLYYRIAKMYGNYIWAFGAILIPTGYLLVLLPIVLYKIYVSKAITVEHRSYPQKPLCVMAIFDCAFNILSSWPLPYISGSIVNILSNVGVPFTMVASMLFLPVHYQWTHYVGALLVVAGVMLRLIPSMTGGENEVMINAALWIPVLVLAYVPYAASNVYKEIGLKNLVSNEWYVNLWIGIWQLLWGVLTVPTVFIPWPNSDDVIAPGKLPEYLNNAFSCFFLQNNFVFEGENIDMCEGVWYWFIAYIAFNVAFNQLMLVVFKRGTSSMAVVASTVRLPLVDMLLLWEWLAGPATIHSISGWDWIALVVIIIGIYSYNSRSEIKRRIVEYTPLVEGAQEDQDNA